MRHEISKDSDMGHGHFLNSTGQEVDIRLSRAPIVKYQNVAHSRAHPRRPPLPPLYEVLRSPKQDNVLFSITIRIWLFVNPFPIP